MFKYIFILFITTNLNSQVSIDKAVDSSLKSSPILNSYYQKIETSKYSIDEIKLSRYGMLNIKSVYTKGDEPVYCFCF